MAALKGLDALIAALQILRKYGNPRRPTHCEHDVMLITPDLDHEKVSEEDIAELGRLRFNLGRPDAAGGETVFYSFDFGKC